MEAGELTVQPAEAPICRRDVDGFAAQRSASLAFRITRMMVQLFCSTMITMTMLRCRRCRRLAAYGWRPHLT